MFYAIHIKAKDINPVFGAETHVVKFYTKADRNGYLVKHKQSQAITAAQSKRMKSPWGLGYTVSDNDIDAVYFGCII